jgi:predicted AAA+ superfamily ATPase
MKTLPLAFIKSLFEKLDGRRIQVLMGPRQVGKTSTLLDHLENHFKTSDYHYESCDAVTNAVSFFTENWKHAVEGKILILDEIQKIDNWSEHIKKLWDLSKKNKHHIRLIILGSSSLKLQQGLTESLTGRFELTKTWQWGLSDSQKGYGLSFEDYLKFGGYPGSYPDVKNLNRWKSFISDSIVDTVVTKDILTQAQVKSPALFRQTFDILSGYPAQEISYNKLLGQIQDRGNIDLVKYYIELFEGAFLMKSLFKYSPKNVLKVKSSSPKIVILAPSLSTYSRLGGLSEEFMGHVFESVVGADLIRAGLDLSYWREAGKEVDFVCTIDGKLFAIEVKTHAKTKTKGLEAFMNLFPKSQPVVVSAENYKSFSKDPIGFLTST